MLYSVSCFLSVPVEALVIGLFNFSTVTINIVDNPPALIGP